MKIFILAAVIGCSFCSVFGQEKLFATLGDSVHVVYDIEKFKNDISDIVFSDYNPKPELSSVEILKLPIIGKGEEFYYSVLLTDISGEIKVAKWLEKENEKLYLIDQFNQDNRLQAYYFTCIGEAGCSPQVLFFEGELGWTCNGSAVCTSDTSCRSIKSLVLD